MDIAELRLVNQKLTSEKLKSPSEIVSHFGAMQAQDYYGAKWSLGLRSKDLADKDVEDSFNKGEILRTHVMRPTWHFVCPEDIRWMLNLTGPRVLAFNGYYYRKSGLDKSIFKKTNKIIEKALTGKKQLTREELNNILKDSKIPTDRLGLSFTIMQAELDGIICSGPRRNKQFTYMLLEERVPKVKEISLEEALLKLVLKYFQSHGPATVQDMMWWSGLTSKDIKKGIDQNNNVLISENIENKAYWFSRNSLVDKTKSSLFLLPTYDEYLIAYKNRSALYEKNATHDKAFENGFWNTVVMNGKVVGSWRRTISKNLVKIYPRFFRKISKIEEDAFNLAVKNYSGFLSLKVVIS